MYSDRINKLINFVKDAHTNHAKTEGKKWRKNLGQNKDKIPYWTHPIAVKELVKPWGYEYGEVCSLEDLEAIALLHDIIEDTFVTITDIEDKLIEIGFSLRSYKRICRAVELLTKKSGQDILDYLEKIKDCHYARTAKLADLEHNMSNLQPGNLLDKYKLCKWYLTH